ncbi:ankyrin repeat domain-containing protein, partial [Legionella fairfieldensis]|uniref:ankyrin repeat domain-containing protein n=1 Tax=Legionella fairfieldensis TaxID=45064 RepID=UPI0013EFA5D0
REKGKAPVASVPKQSAPSGPGLFPPASAPKVKGLSQADQQAINLVNDFTDKRLLIMFKSLKKDFWTSASSHRIKDHLNNNQEAQTVFFACLVNHYELIDLAPLNAFLTYKPIKKNKKLLSRLQILEDIFTECRQKPLEFKMKRLKNNASIVHIAAYFNKPEWIKWLHSFGANLNLPACKGYTPAFIAVQERHIEVFRTLIKLGINVNQPEDSGKTLAYVVVEKEECEPFLRILKESGADFNQADENDWTPVLVATKKGFVSVVRTLIELGANVNQADKDGWSPLYVATRNRNEPMLRTLFELGADVNQADKNGWSPLYVATRNRNEPMLRTLFELGADVNQADKNGWSPLYVATLDRNEPILRTLLELGADVNQPGPGGLPLIYTAVVNGDEPIFKTLIDFGAKLDGNFSLTAAELIGFGRERSVEIQEKIHKTLVRSGMQGKNDKFCLTLMEIAEITGIDVAKITGHNEAKKILSDSPDSSSDRTSFFRVNVPLPAPSNKPGNSFTS